MEAAGDSAPSPMPMEAEDGDFGEGPIAAEGVRDR